MAFKKNVISDDLSNYSICVLGESGVGKTTLMKEACEKEFGEDGYVIFNMGKEQGIDCIDNAVYADIPDWKTFAETIKDIVENKDKDYPDLKVVVIDTLDQAIEIAEPECVRLWNVENTGKKDFTKVKTINQSWGGFGRGEDKVIEIILNEVWKLQKAGVRVWYTGHVKTREIVDPITNMTYTTLSTNMMTKYFNGFKTKMHVVGIAAIDRTIETESTGRKNIVTKKDITVNKVKEERRKIVFRDDSYSVDSKSRLSGIVDSCLMDSDEFLKTLKDAIANSKATPSKPTKAAPKKAEPKKVVEPTPEPEPVVEPEPDIDDIDSTPTEPVATESEYPADIEQAVRDKFKAADKDVKAKVRALLNGTKLVDADEELMKQLYDVLK